MLQSLAVIPVAQSIENKNLGCIPSVLRVLSRSKHPELGTESTSMSYMIEGIDISLCENDEILEALVSQVSQLRFSLINGDVNF